MRYISNIIALVVILSPLWGCSPKLPTSEQTTPSQWLYGGEQLTSDTLQLNERWWESFGDTTLNRLISHALESNKDISIAAAKVEASYSEIRYLRSSYLPSIYLSMEAEGEYTSSTKIVQEYTIEPTLSWEIPLWGALRHTNRKGRAELAEAKWAEAGMRLSVASQVAVSYFTLLQMEASLEIARRSYDLRLEELRLNDSLFQYGMSSGIIREQSRSLLYSAESDIYEYQRGVAQTAMSLSLLLGESPNPTIVGEEIEPLHRLMGSLPEPISLGIPSDLLERRPDILQSYSAASAAAAEVGLARAARFPSITLTADGGLLSSTIKGLTSDQPWAWSVVGELVQPIFNFGRLKSSERIARMEYREALLSYEQTILTALSEVERALIALSTYEAQRSTMGELVRANEYVVTTIRALYNSGMEDYLEVIDAEREYYSAQLELLSVVVNQLMSYVDLYKSLGGGV